jgi:hypothetical protein
VLGDFEEALAANVEKRIRRRPLSLTWAIAGGLPSSLLRAGFKELN